MKADGGKQVQEVPRLVENPSTGFALHFIVVYLCVYVDILHAYIGAVNLMHSLD